MEIRLSTMKPTISARPGRRFSDANVVRYEHIAHRMLQDTDVIREPSEVYERLKRRNPIQTTLGKEVVDDP